MARSLPYGLGIIPRGLMLPTEPVYWNWEPPSAADWERARYDRRYDRPVDDEEMVAFRVLVRWCRYRCGICGTSDPKCRIVMDHDHQTRSGLCRGLLCFDCNRREGFSGPAVFGLYRERPPALICGTEVGYWPSSTLPASPELLQFQEDILTAKQFRVIRDNRPWLASEIGIASRDDLTDAQVARIVGRKESAVRSRRRGLTLGPPDIDAWL